MLVVLAALAVHPELGFLLVERERDGDKPIRVVVFGVIARYHDARITNLHLSPRSLSNGVDAKQTVAPVRRENGKEV